MVTQFEKSFCLLEFDSTKSVITVQWQFRRKFWGYLPTVNSIRKWYEKFVLSVRRRADWTWVWKQLIVFNRLICEVQGSRHVGLTTIWKYHSQVCGNLFKNTLVSYHIDCKCCNTAPNHRMVHFIFCVHLMTLLQNIKLLTRTLFQWCSNISGLRVVINASVSWRQTRYCFSTWSSTTTHPRWDDILERQFFLQRST